MRQLRVRPKTCDVPAMFRGTVDECFAPYSIFPNDEAPFGPPGHPLKWQYSTSSTLSGMLSSGRFATYYGGGYVTDLPSNATRAREAVIELKEGGWIDRATRAVFVDMSCFNANTESFM